MAAPRPSKTHIGNHALKPETLMLSYGYDPALSEGAVKPPVRRSVWCNREDTDA